MATKSKAVVIALGISICAVPGQRGADAQKVAGPTIAVALQKQVITQREPVIVDVTLANPSREAVDLDLGYEYEGVAVRVTDPDGRVWPKPQPAIPNEGQEFRRGIPVAPGATGVESIVLSGWFDFERVGQYEIEIAVPPSRNSSARVVALKNTPIFLTVLPRDESALRSACANLVQRVTNRHAVEEAETAAKALAGVDDPAAVPYMAEAARVKVFAPMMIGALARLKTPEAVRALISVSRSSDPETRALARAALVAKGEAEPRR